MHEDDSQCIREIVKGLDEREYAFIQERDFDCREMKALYSCFDFILATRFHSAIFAMSQNVPALVISYGGNKGEGIMRIWGWENMWFRFMRLLSMCCCGNLKV